MPTKITQRERFDEAFGPVRIDVDALIAELKRYQNPEAKITAKVGDLKFAGLADMEANKAQLAGYPDIEIGEVRVSIGRLFTTVSAFNVDNDDTRNNATNIYQFLKAHKSRAHFIIFWVVVLVLGVGGGELFVSLKDPEGVSGRTVSVGVLLVLLFFMFGGLKLLKNMGNRFPAVFYNPRETFWQKHGKEVMIGVGSSAVTALVAYLIC